MYLRFSTLIDLCAQIVHIRSRQALAERLGVGISTLNAYRAGTRFPEQGPAALLRSNIQYLLFDAISLTQDSQLKNFDCEAYVLSCFNIENHFRHLNKNFPIGDIGKLASQIAFLVFSEAKIQNINYLPPDDVKSILILLLRQQPSIYSLSNINKWIFDSYINYISDKTHGIPLSHPMKSVPDFISLYQENNNITIVNPQAWDIVLTCTDRASFITSLQDQNEDRIPSTKFNVTVLGNDLQAQKINNEGG